MPQADQKPRQNGQQTGRAMGTVHHCPVCKAAQKPQCVTEGHIEFCQAPTCGKTFTPRFGCAKHTYSKAWNLEVLAKFRNTTLDDLVKAREQELAYHNLPEDASTEVKLSALYKQNGHDDEYKKAKEQAEKKAEPKGSKRSSDASKRASTMANKHKKFGNG